MYIYVYEYIYTYTYIFTYIYKYLYTSDVALLECLLHSSWSRYCSQFQVWQCVAVHCNVLQCSFICVT